MAINLFAFVASYAIAGRRRGLSPGQVGTAALVGGIIKPPILGIVLASAIANSETPAGGTRKAYVAAAASLSGKAPLAIAAGATAPPGMISFHGMDRAQSEKYAAWLGLSPQFEGTGRVEWQEPGIDRALPADGILKLRLGSK